MMLLVYQKFLRFDPLELLSVFYVNRQSWKDSSVERNTCLLFCKLVLQWEAAGHRVLGLVVAVW